MLELNNNAHARHGLIAGVDEVGRGPLAGAVVAAAVILDHRQPISGLMDSKALSEKKREALSHIIKRQALAWAIARVEPDEIDRINILQASLLAMHRAVDQLSCKPDHVLVDGNRCPNWDYSCQAIVKGDSKEQAIAAASIIAKVFRDEEMIAQDLQYPGYGFAQHKGYPTKAHQAALKEKGPSAIHRRSFAPVRALLDEAQL